MKQLAFFTGMLLLFSSFRSSDTPKDTSALDTVLDGWHKAAATANLADYFGCVTDDFVFLGTDPKERWTKEEFKKFCEPYFADGKGWDFKSSNRHWMFSADGKIAWFDEDLATWMEGCRGSGVMVKKGKTWKLAYYNLTVLIENEKIKPFIELRKQ